MLVDARVQRRAQHIFVTCLDFLRALDLKDCQTVFTDLPNRVPAGLARCLIDPNGLAHDAEDERKEHL